MPFEVTILGSGSATPTKYRRPTSQIINIRDQLLLMDCGEGTQMQLFRYKIKLNRIHHIFISHLHGDHYLGLMGLIATMNLNRRTEPLHLFGPPALEQILQLHFDGSGTVLSFDLFFMPTDAEEKVKLCQHELFWVETVPLSHRIPTTGFIFHEADTNRKILKAVCDKYQIPVDYYDQLKAGKDYRTDDGELIANDILTKPGANPQSYAFCSDTIHDPELSKLIKGVDCLYHEATFLQDQAERAKTTFHSTAREAAMVAKEAAVDKLLIGHFSARYFELSKHLEEARAVFPNTELAVEGARFDIRSAAEMPDPEEEES